MARIPQNVIFVWTGTHASIPTGWTRETTLDNKYLKGAATGVDPADGSGSNTHSHTSTAHSHSISAHTHNVTLSANTYGSRSCGKTSSGGPTSNHGHVSKASGAASGTSSSEAATYTSTNSEPDHKVVIFIKSDGTHAIPDNAVGFTKTSVFSGWAACDGGGVTRNYVDAFMKGANTGADAVGTWYGNATHTHSITHTHTASHTHVQSTSGAYTATTDFETASGTADSVQSHSHDITLNSKSIAIGGTPTSGAESNNPLYKKLVPIHNTAGSSAAPPRGIVAIWIGTLANIPAGWDVVSEMEGYYMRGTATVGQIGDTGGSNTHSHTGDSHTHTGATHNHVATVEFQVATNNLLNSDRSLPKPHSHGSTVSNTAATHLSASTTGASTNNEPDYYSVAFIEFTSYANVSKANIIRFNEEKENQVKGQVVYKQSSGSSAKMNIVHTTPVGNQARANIRKAFTHKTFEYRIYDDNSFVTTWSEEVISIPTFRATINGGAGELRIKLARQYDSFGEGTDVKLFNKVDCYVFDLEAPQGDLLYSGFISSYAPVMDGHSEYVEVVLLPYISEMEHLMLREGSNDTEVAYSSEDPTDVFKGIIDLYRIDSTNINYTATSMDDTSTTVTYTFKNYTVKEALDKAIELTPEDWYWYITPENTIYLKETDLSTADHDLVIGKHFTRLQTERRMEDMVNSVYFVGADSGGTNIYRYYTNSAAVDAYGIRAKKMVDQRVSNTDTIDIKANRVIDDKKDPEIRTTATILDSNGPNIKHGYDIESIKPGDSMRLKNIKQATKTVTYWDQGEWDVDVWDQTLAYAASSIIQVQSIQYHPNYLIIETSSRLPEVPKRMEDIYRNLEETETDNTSATPTAA